LEAVRIISQAVDSMVFQSLRPPGPAEIRRLTAILSRPAEDAAPALLGTVIVRPFRGRLLAAQIVETEAYLGAKDPASHAFRGRTERTVPLWGPPGTVYVYFVYGMHYCLNLAASLPGVPECVLIRAAEPLEGSGLASDSCRGPGRLCRALRISARESGRNLFEPGSRLYLREGAPPRSVGVSPRVGILSAADRPLRFYDAESPAVSRPYSLPKLRASSRVRLKNAGSRVGRGGHSGGRFRKRPP
jgi:DNA-3-methyladenine glycosylase